mgnify:FL=1
MAMRKENEKLQVAAAAAVETTITTKLTIEKSIKKVLKEVGTSLLSNSYSAPSIAIKVFFKKFNSMKIEPKIKLVEEKYIRNSYFGGRTEVFGNPKSGELIHYFDFSGMYGQCMLEKFPIQIKEFKFENLNLSEIGFHTIEYESDSYIPILPTKNNFDSKLMFKNGKQKGTYWYEEINFFLKNGGKINKHISSLVYDGYDNIFSNYVNFFTNLRKKDGYYKVFGKLMINSLYGGFGLRSDNGFTIITFSQIEFDYILKNFDISSYTKLNDCFIMDIILNFKSENYFNQKKKWENLELSLSERNLTYASIIASKARIKLNKALLQTINNGGRLYYCDTDSIFAGYKKSRINLNEGEITWLKTYKDAVFASPKCYALLGEEADIKIKGIRTTYKNFEDFKNKFYTGSGILFKNELQINKKNMQLTQKYIEKNINLANYTKRIFDIDKKNTFPIKVVEQDPDI